MSKILLLNAYFNSNLSGIRSRSSVITTYEKIFHLLGHSAKYPLQAALSLSVCLAPNNMVTPSGALDDDPLRAIPVFDQRLVGACLGIEGVPDGPDILLRK